VASTASAEIEHMRGVWARQVNMALERHQVEQRVDHRSFERQGKEQEPTRHMGVSATAMERVMISGPKPEDMNFNEDDDNFEEDNWNAGYYSEDDEEE
jgi:hypothetical protein